MSWEEAMKKNETNEICSPISMAPEHFFRECTSVDDFFIPVHTRN